MDIGKEKKKITVEPVRNPVPDKNPTPATPPVEPKKEPVKI